MGGGDSHIPSEIRERQTYSVAKSFHKHLQRLVRIESFSDCGKLTVPGNDKFPSDLSQCKRTNTVEITTVVDAREWRMAFTLRKLGRGLVRRMTRRAEEVLCAAGRVVKPGVWKKRVGRVR